MSKPKNPRKSRQSRKSRKSRTAKPSPPAIASPSPFGDDVATAACEAARQSLATGDLEAALGCIQGAIALQPDCLDALLLLGRIHQQAKRFAAAARAYYSVLDRDPLHLEALSYVGGLCVSLDEGDAARQCFERAITLQPSCSTAHYNLGLIAERAEDWTTAIAHFEMAARDRALGAMPWFRLGVVHLRHHRDDQAEAAFGQALGYEGTRAEIWSNLTYARQNLGNLTGAIAAVRQALALAPENAAYHFSLAVLLLTTGQWEEGWRAYEWRLHQKHYARLMAEVAPLWGGDATRQDPERQDPESQDLDSPDRTTQTLVIRGEQGLGDTLQFCRYLAHIHPRFGRTIFKCRPSLHRLMATVEGVDAVADWGEDVGPFDAGIPLLSLPHRCQANPDRDAVTIPYLRVPDGVVCPFHRDPDRPTVGLVWASGYRPLAEHLEHYHDKSCPLPTLASALADRDRVAARVQWVSLQVGRDAGQLAELQTHGTPDPDRFDCLDLSDRLTDFADTAAAIAQLDLVISVDTAVAHLAGALGKPVWILLPFNNDWRWLRDREDTPWYPTARLFRQRSRHAWPDLAERVAHAVDAWLTDGGDP